ncbi:hypothetical protein [Micromonospora sp. 4G55]|uniref:hypothetical protein n=1 Tax=Micromonospora sp. 4G55 TaxID=2806102 RepID=UPI001A51F3B4|nr:hypothetical protein [Micromonospora sp. 4G55]MBM0259259.1 hypothetical protein [Micromonospora sp. 4G55]
MQKQSERWLIVAAILLASLLTTVALVSTLENASFLAGLVSAVITTVALLAVYRRERADPEPAAGGEVQPASFARIFTGRQWLAVVAGVVACGVVGAAVSLSGAGDSGGGEDATNNDSLTPTTASTTPSVALTDPTPTGTADPTNTPGPTGSPSTPVDDAPTVVYLGALEPAEGDRFPKAAMLSGQPYTNSAEIACWYPTSDPVEWNVAGYQKLTATLGVDDNAEQPSGRTAQFFFHDQAGRTLRAPVEVAVGQPKSVSIDLKGVVRLRVNCAGRDTRSNRTQRLYAVMGDAQISR